MKIVVCLAFIVVLLTWYAIFGRAWLQSKDWLAPFFAFVEPIEIALFKKSETILMGRLLWVGGGLVTAYDMAAAFLPNLDLSPVTSNIFDALHVPDVYRAIITSAVIAGIGLVMNWLRGRVSKPLELVALPDKVVAENPKVAEAVAMADATKTEAVAAVAEAKAS